MILNQILGDGKRGIYVVVSVQLIYRKDLWGCYKNMKNMLAKLKPLVWLFIFASIFGLGFGFYHLYTQVNEISNSFDSSRLQVDEGTLTESQQVSAPLISSTGCSQDCQEKIAEAVSTVMATISGSTTKEVAQTTTVITSPASGISYVPLGSTATTTSTDWVDVEDSSVYIDLTNDYGESATVSWEVSLKVAHGNGKAYARLYDDTNKIAVDFSEISTTDNADFVQVSTGDLPFWRGRNLYKVQIKSLNSFEITYSGGKLRINY